jgi:hypothetical protein
MKSSAPPAFIPQQTRSEFNSGRHNSISNL